MKYLSILSLLLSVVAIFLVLGNYLVAGLPAGGLLSPPGGGLLSPSGGWQRSGTTTSLIQPGDIVGIGTSSPDSTANLSINDSGQATATLKIVSQFGTRGGCLEFEGPASTTFRLYATSSQLAFFESGACR